MAEIKQAKEVFLQQKKEDETQKLSKDFLAIRTSLDFKKVTAIVIMNDKKSNNTVSWMTWFISFNACLLQGISAKYFKRKWIAILRISKLWYCDYYEGHFIFTCMHSVIVLVTGWSRFYGNWILKIKYKIFLSLVRSRGSLDDFWSLKFGL